MNSNTLAIANHSREVVMSELISDDLSEPSSPDPDTFDESDILGTATISCTPCNSDDLTNQLAAAGPVGVAAAAAILSGRKRRRHHSFEINPSIRKRQQTRLLRKLKNIIHEYIVRVGQQATVVVCTPGKMSQNAQSFKVFGSQPLENVIRGQRTEIMQTLEGALLQHAPPHENDNPNVHDLPPLVIDGIPTPVDKMTQAQLRAFIPEMLKYSTGRSKPGWGKHEYRPSWWPIEVPWANVRSDVRADDDKKKLSWTTALRMIVKNCYKYHEREDLLPVFDEYSVANGDPNAYQAGTMVQTINNPDGTLRLIHIDTGTPSGTVVTLPDGSQATIVHSSIAADGAHIVQQGTNTQGNNQLPTFTEATINQDGQIIITGDPGLGAIDSVGTKYGIVKIPVSMYQTFVGGGGLSSLADGSTMTDNLHTIPEANIQAITDPNMHTITEVKNIHTITDSDGNTIHTITENGEDIQIMTDESGNIQTHTDNIQSDIQSDNLHDDNIIQAMDEGNNLQMAEPGDTIHMNESASIETIDETRTMGDTTNGMRITLTHVGNVVNNTVPDASSAVEVESGT